MIFLLRVVLHPLLSRRFIQFYVRFILAGDLSILRIISLGRAHERLQRNESCADGQRRGPLVLENVKANSTSLGADVGMPNLCLELHLWGLEGIVCGNYYVDIEDATLIASIFL